MKHKTIIAILFVIAYAKSFSQITMPNQNNLPVGDKNKYAIIEIGKYRSFGNESTILFYGNGKTEDLSDLLYSTKGNKYLPDLKTDNYTENESISEPLKALVCIQYMAEKNYVLVSSNATRWEGIYGYQYVFEKKEN